jgi:hypothetical protein
LFEREHHQRIATVLQALDGVLLAGHACLFGGGTALALRYGEYRESVDVDFVVSDAGCYSALRQLLTGPSGLAPLVRPGMALELAREVRADQYGIRTLVRVGGQGIKFEIVREARIAIEGPGPDDVVCGVATLTPRDLAACKLLANSDRWRDDAVYSRDLIDLAMMAPPRALLLEAVAKAEGAYGASVRRDLARAIQRLREQPSLLAECMRAMRMQAVPKALLWQRIRNLERMSR